MIHEANAYMDWLRDAFRALFLATEANPIEPEDDGYEADDEEEV